MLSSPKAFYCHVRQYGDNLLYIGYDENGTRIQTKIPFSPTLYLKSKNDTSKTACYDGTLLDPVNFSSINDAKEFIKSYKDVQDFTIYGNDKFACEYIAKTFPKEISYDTSIMRIFATDIEVFSGNGFPDPYEAKEQITAITNWDSKTDKFITWGLKDYDPSKSEVIHKYKMKHEYRQFSNEIDMLNDFLNYWTNNYPDIVTGWNSRGFDIPYIINRIIKLLGEAAAKRLSPWNIIREKTSNIKRMGGYESQIQYEIYGIAELDYMDLYKKYSTHNSESFKLDFIAHTELGESKLKYDGSLEELYNNDHQKYIDYNIHDVNIIKMLEAKIRFLDLLIEVAYAGKVATFNDALGTVKYWEILVYNHLYQKNQFPEIKDISPSKDEQYTGAFVKEPKVGKHKWVVSFDLASLYPSVIRQVNIGPETLVAVNDLPTELKEFLGEVRQQRLVNKTIDTSILKQYNLSLSGNAKLYRKDRQSFFSELMEQFFNKRKEYKKLALKYKDEYQKTKDPEIKKLAGIYDIKQHALKILINSAYGAIGNPYFQYYSTDNAQAVTVTGQVVIQWAELRVNQYLNTLLKTKDVDYALYIDTDSLYLNFDPIVTAMGLTDQLQIINFLDKLSNEKINPFLTKIFDELFELLNSYTNNMVMVRDVISDVAVWTGKKRYFMNVHDSEGVRYNPPQMKIMGIEVVKSSTPNVCRDKLRKALLTVLTGKETDLQKFIEQFKNEFYSLKAEQIAFPRGVSEIEKYTANNEPIKGTPIHVRGSIVYNGLLKKHELTKTREAIRDGTKVKFIYLKEPNITKGNTIAFTDELPSQFGLEKFIDYDLQFEKSFLAPLKDILDLIGWSIEEEFNLDNIFG